LALLLLKDMGEFVRQQTLSTVARRRVHARCEIDISSTGISERIQAGRGFGRLRAGMHAHVCQVGSEVRFQGPARRGIEGFPVN
jgi:hypothetical protein